MVAAIRWELVDGIADGERIADRSWQEDGKGHTPGKRLRHICFSQKQLGRDVKSLAKAADVLGGEPTPAPHHFGDNAGGAEHADQIFLLQWFARMSSRSASKGEARFSA